MTDEEMWQILDRGMRAAARVLVERVEAKECSAADIAQLRSMYKDAGGSLQFSGVPTATGDAILDSLANIDPDMLN